MRSPWRRFTPEAPALSLVLAVAVCVTTAGIAWLGSRATSEWRRSSRQVLDGQAQVTLALLMKALDRDMQRAHTALLLPLGADLQRATSPHDVRWALAGGFVRFPYMEWFFTAGHHQGRRETWLFSRAERPPPWAVASTAIAHPVVMTANVSAMDGLVAEIQRRAVRAHPFVAFEWNTSGRRYQIVADVRRLADTRHPGTTAGFAVDLEWARAHYFPELLAEIARIAGRDAPIALAVLDVSDTAPRPAFASGHTSTFELLFAVRSLLPPHDSPRVWTAHAQVRPEAAAAATLGADRTLRLLSVAAAVGAIGLVLTIRTTQQHARLAAMRSEFVANVTHELKTPVAAIRLAAEAIAGGRHPSLDAVQQYARDTYRHAERLARLIDNLLTHARVANMPPKYRFEPVEVPELVDDVLTRFSPLLLEQHFELNVDVPLELPPIRGDRTALLRALDNVVDNAIKYSAERRRLDVRARRHEGHVHIEVEDQGCGIPESERTRVFEPFRRGREAVAGGSGLGLAIVQRVVADHDGRIELRSEVGRGTCVTLVLPVAR